MPVRSKLYVAGNRKPSNEVGVLPAAAKSVGRPTAGTSLNALSTVALSSPSPQTPPGGGVLHGAATSRAARSSVVPPSGRITSAW